MPTTTIIDPIGDLHHPLAMELVGNSREIKCISSLRDLAGGLGHQTRVALFPADLLEFLAPRRTELLPNASLVAWTNKNVRRTFELAAEIDEVAAILAWPLDNVSPRSWEIAATSSHLLANRVVPLDPLELCPRPLKHGEWSLRSTADLTQRVGELEEIVKTLGVQRRAGSRVSAVAHELFMNAVYDAPVDAQGRPLYAHDRTARVQLARTDEVRVCFATDGEGLFLQVADRFGGLRREHVYSSIRRGFRSADADARPQDFIDSSHGGAGLGMHRIVTGAGATVFEVIPGVATVVTVFFDLRLGNREARTNPRSLHFYRAAQAASAY